MSCVWEEEYEECLGPKPTARGERAALCMCLVGMHFNQGERRTASEVYGDDANVAGKLVCGSQKRFHRVTSFRPDGDKRLFTF